MSSSISNFRTEWKVVALVLAVLAAAEVGMRTLGTRLSGDERTMAALPGKIKQLHDSHDQKVVILGNSLTLCGIDEKLVQSKINPIGVGVVAFQGATEIEWYHLFKQFIAQPNVEPNVLVIPFAGWLDDQAPIELPRLATHSNFTNACEILTSEIRNEDNGIFLHNWMSVSFASRARVRLVVLDSFLPEYTSCVTRMKSTISAATKGGSETQTKTYNVLRKMLDLANSRGVRVVLLAMPTRRPYDIPTDLSQFTDQKQCTLLDLRNAPDLSPDKFADSTHLTPEGAKLFSAYMAKMLSTHLGNQ